MPHGCRREKSQYETFEAVGRNHGRSRRDAREDWRKSASYGLKADSKDENSSSRSSSRKRESKLWYEYAAPEKQLSKRKLSQPNNTESCRGTHLKRGRSSYRKQESWDSKSEYFKQAKSKKPSEFSYGVTKEHCNHRDSSEAAQRQRNPYFPDTKDSSSKRRCSVSSISPKSSCSDRRVDFPRGSSQIPYDADIRDLYEPLDIGLPQKQKSVEVQTDVKDFPETEKTIGNLKTVLSAALARIKCLEFENSVLTTNISALYYTAREELQRSANTLTKQNVE